MSGGSDASSKDQVVARDLIKGQAGQLHGRRSLPPPHVPSPRQQWWHRRDGEEGQRQQRRQHEEGHDGVLRKLPEQTSRHFLTKGAGHQILQDSNGRRLQSSLRLAGRSDAQPPVYWTRIIPV